MRRPWLDGRFPDGVLPYILAQTPDILIEKSKKTMLGAMIRYSTHRVLVFLFLLGGIFGPRLWAEEVRVVEGVLDLTEYDFTQGSSSVVGEFGFRWGVWENPVLGSAPTGPFLAVPGYWTQADPALPGQGVATYRVKILLPAGDRIWSFYYPETSTASALFINGRRLAHQGTPSLTAGDERPQYKPQLVAFVAPDGVADVVIQVSNWNYRKGGLWSPPKIGTEELMRRTDDRTIVWELLMIGAFLALALYNVSLYVRGLPQGRSQDLAGLWLMLTCLEIVARILVTGDNLAVRYFDLDWEWGRKLEFLPMHLGSLFFFSFLNKLFPREIQPWMVRYCVGGAWVLGVPALLLPARITNNFVEVGEVFLLSYLIVYVIIVVQAFRRRREGASIMFYSTLGLVAGVTNDIVLSATSWVGLGSFFPFAGFAFIFLQSVLLSLRYSNLGLRADQLTLDLHDLNQAMNRFVPVQTLPDLVLLADAGGTNLQASAPMARLLGLTDDELRGLTLPQALPGWPDLPQVWTALQQDQRPREGLSGTIGTSRFLLSLVPSRDKHQTLGGVIVRITGADDWDEAFERFGISAREREVCRLLLEGQTNQQIADKLFISPGTVKNHLQNLFRKTGAANRVELLRVLQKP